MRLLKLAKLLKFILFSGTLAALPAQAVPPAYAPSKHRLCEPCVMPISPVSLPRQGIVLSYGSFLSDGSTWYLVDLDRAEAIRVFARFDRRTNEQSVVEKVIRPLLPGELSALTDLVNRIWASEQALPTHRATDVVWDLWLLDSGAVRRDFGPGLPDGLAKEVEQMMNRLVGPEVPIRRNASPR